MVSKSFSYSDFFPKFHPHASNSTSNSYSWIIHPHLWYVSHSPAHSTLIITTRVQMLILLPGLHDGLSHCLYPHSSQIHQLSYCQMRLHNTTLTSFEKLSIPLHPFRIEQKFKLLSVMNLIYPDAHSPPSFPRPHYVASFHFSWNELLSVPYLSQILSFMYCFWLGIPILSISAISKLTLSYKA